MKKVSVILGIVLALGLLATLIVNVANEDEPTDLVTASVNENTETVQQETTETEQSANKTFTAEEVSLHNSSSDCWTIINGGVYDLTSYISSHPGGDEIERACGVDGTILFESRTTESGERVGSGTSHSSSASSQLEQLKIGTLTS
ncbi:cytochrome b5 domain-containing protein [Candidatus Saccharibacteria bacterium]|nr:cytochrome b5 domain-containing protein [Candidatus Saccharibacteria bacterium]